jgi:hypothetical protein
LTRRLNKPVSANPPWRVNVGLLYSKVARSRIWVCHAFGSPCLAFSFSESPARAAHPPSRVVIMPFWEGGTTCLRRSRCHPCTDRRSVPVLPCHTATICLFSEGVSGVAAVICARTTLPTLCFPVTQPRRAQALPRSLSQVALLLFWEGGTTCQPRCRCHPGVSGGLLLDFGYLYVSFPLWAMTSSTLLW